MVGKKGGLAAPLFCLGLAAAVLASREPPLLLLAAAATLTVAAAWLGPRPYRVFGSALSIAVASFAAVLLGSTWLWGGHYTPVAVYTIALFVGAFYVGRDFAEGGKGHIALTILAVLAGVTSAWGLWNYAHYVRLGDPLGYPRAAAWFETPNLMAAFVNLALVPLVVIVLLRGSRLFTVFALVILSAGLTATHSRGGWLGATVAAGAVILLLVGTGWRPSLRRLGTIALSFAAGYALVQLAPALPLFVGEPSSSVAPSAQLNKAFSAGRAASSAIRFELYSVAANGVLEHPVIGSGYLNFRRLFDRVQARVPSYEPGTETRFVHDDYLQVLYELGLLGLVPFIAITALPGLLAYGRKNRFQPASPRDALGIAAVAGLATMATHALVDFPFYAPGTLAGYGLLLGVADDWLHPAAPAAAQVSRRPSGFGRLLRLALFALGAYALAVPAAAETCSLLARDRVRHGNISAAVYWLQVARNFDPRDWRRHWQLAELLAQQAALLRDPKLAQLAADAYETGMRADPGDVHNLLGWLTLQRRFGARLAHPASRAQLLARMTEASALAPLDTAVRVERMLVLRYLGEPAAAQVVAQGLLRDFPDDPALRRLVDSGARS